MNYIITLRSALRGIWEHRNLATILAIRDTKAKYRGSFFGIFWAVIPPIAAAIGLAAAKGAGVISLGNTSIPYPAYVIFGMSLWQIFTAAITLPISALSGAKGVLTKVDFPREVIILSEINKLVIFVLLQTILVVIVFAIFGVAVNKYFILAVIPIISLILLGLAISLLLAPLALLYGDISNAMPLVMGGMFFVTPVVFALPREGGVFSFVVRHNPLTMILEFSRELLYGPSFPAFFPQFLIVLVFTILLASFALVFFHLAMPVVVERWSA